MCSQRSHVNFIGSSSSSHILTYRGVWFVLVLEEKLALLMDSDDVLADNFNNCLLLELFVNVCNVLVFNCIDFVILVWLETLVNENNSADSNKIATGSKDVARLIVGLIILRWCGDLWCLSNQNISHWWKINCEPKID